MVREGVMKRYGMMEHWKVGIMECWSNGVVENPTMNDGTTDSNAGRAPKAFGVTKNAVAARGLPDLIFL